MITTKFFHYDAAARLLSAELSDLGDAALKREVGGLALDVTSEETGATVRFTVVKREQDVEGDLLAYHLQPTAKAVAVVPAAKGLRMVLFND